jgi:nitrous oxidase accessory protein
MKNQNISLCLIFSIMILIGTPLGSVMTPAENTVTITIYVDDNANPSWYDVTHVKTIREGIINASDGDTIYVFNGTYYENITISKSIHLVGEDQHTTIIDGLRQGSVIMIEKNNITISGFTIQNGTDNTIWERYAIQIPKKLIGPDTHLRNFTISQCIITDNRGGILLHNVTNCHINNCSFYDNSASFIIRFQTDNISIDKSTFFHNGKQINENNIYNGGVVIDGYNFTCTDIVMTHCKIDNNVGEGIILSCAQNISVDHSIVSNSSWFGMVLSGVKNISIHHNVISGNQRMGLYIPGSADNVLIDNNRIAYNGRGGFLPDDCNAGIYFYNLIDNIQIIHNNITSNFRYGIYFSHSRNNHLLNNNFINNTVHVSFSAYSLWNTWQGNYWDNWIGSGPMTIKGKLRGSTLHFPIPWYNFDWHPAKKPYVFY